MCFFFFKQKTAYEMRISDWSSDVCSSDLAALLKSALKPWTGDLDGMVSRNMIRVAIPYGIATDFLDGPTQKGVTYDLALAFEKHLKKHLGRKDSELTMVVVPTRRDEIFQLLADGRADVAAGSLTVTEERARDRKSVV